MVSSQSVVGERTDLCSTGRTLGVPGGLSVLVTSASAVDGLLTCGGETLIPQPPPPCSMPVHGSGSIQPGQRFTDPASGLEVICTRAGHGVLTFAGRPMQHPVTSAGSLPAPRRGTGA